MPTQEVVVKKVPVVAGASVRETISTMGDIGRLFDEVFTHLGRHMVTPEGPPLGIYHDEEFRERDVDDEVALPVREAVPEEDRVKGRQLPAVEEMACIVHEGSYETVGATYGHLMAWVEANGYRISGPVREVYLQGPESGDDPSTYVTEIQLPATRA